LRSEGSFFGGLTDHHAILPTGKAPPAGLAGPLRRAFDLVVTRFVAVFLPDQQVEETQATLDIGGSTFLARGALELDPGWTRAMPRRRRGSDDPKGEGGRKPMPPLAVGQTCRVERLEVQEKETEPPRPYDDATLLAAMKNAGRSIEDEALAEAMKASGLGTPATRAETIEKLIRTGYVERRRKQLLSTDKGRALIGLVAAPLRSPELTAEWEQRLKDVELGSAVAEAFYQGIVALVRELLPQVAAGAALTPEQVAVARTGNLLDVVTRLGQLMQGTGGIGTPGVVAVVQGVGIEFFEDVPLRLVVPAHGQLEFFTFVSFAHGVSSVGRTLSAR
jgi:DNA topoisomerase-3